MIKKLFFLLFVCFSSISVTAQNNYEGNNLFTYMDEPFAGEKAMQLQQAWNIIKMAERSYYSPGKNFDISLSGNDRISRIEMKDLNPQHEILGRYDGVLPLNLQWGMSMPEITRKTGSTHEKHSGNTLYYHYDRNIDVVLNFTDANEQKEYRLSGVVIKYEDHFGNYAKADPKLKPLLPDPANYKYLVPQKNSVVNNKVIQQNNISQANDFCSIVKNLLAESAQNFSSQKKTKQLTAKSWQLENKIPAALFSALNEEAHYSGSKKYIYKATMKGNLAQGSESNKALDELKNKLTACLAGYTIEEFVTSRYSDNPDDVAGYSWKKGVGQSFVELKRDVDAYNKASIYIIINSK